jgi:hypothetical protein
MYASPRNTTLNAVSLWRRERLIRGGRHFAQLQPDVRADFYFHVAVKTGFL